VPRPLDVDVSRRILAATVELLEERGYGRLSLDAVAQRANVGRPALYRRFSGKRELCVEAIGSLLPPPLPQVEGDAETRLRAIFTGLAAPGLVRYVGLVGELLGREPGEPELIAAWREHVLAPRRQVALDILGDAKAAGVLRAGVEPQFALDSFTGQLLARVWQGAPIDDAWKEETWRQLWAAIT
jgi:AcrR family transcriptional regulator